MDKNDYLLLHDESVDCNTINRCLYALHKSVDDKLDEYLNQTSANIPSSPFFKDGIDNALVDSPSLTGYGLKESTSGTAGVVRRLFSDDISKSSFETLTPSGVFTYEKESISEFVPSVKALFTDKSTSIFSSVFSSENGTFQTGEKTLVTISQPKIKYNSYILFGDIGVAFGTITLSRTNADSQNLYIKLSIIDDLICRKNIDTVKFLTITNGYASGIREVSENLDMVSEINSASITYLTDDEIVIHNITKNDSSDKININKSTYRIVEDDFIDENSLKDEYLTIDNNEYSLNYFCIFKTRDMMSEYTFDDWCFYIIKNNLVDTKQLSNAIKWAYHNTEDTFSNFRFADAGSYLPDADNGPYITSGLVTNANDAFNGCYNATFENLSGFSENLRYADRMFKSCSNATFESLPINLEFNKMVSAQSMFENCNVALFSSIASIIIPNANKLCNMFNNCPKAEFAQLVELFISGDCSKMFYNCRSASFDSLTSIDGNIYSTASMFNGCEDATFRNLESITSDYKGKVDASNMFAGNEVSTFENLSTINLGTLYDGTSMFEGCRNSTFNALTSIGNIENAPYMFKDCESLELTSLVKDSFSTISIGTAMFDNCKKLNLSVDSLANLYNGEYMFRNTNDISIGSLPKLSLANSMFYSCHDVTIGAGTNSSLTDATNMCRYSNTVTVSTDFNRLVDATHMFSDCKTVEVSTIPDSLIEMDEMFSNTKNSTIHEYKGSISKPRFATNAFYKNDTVIIEDGNIIDGNLYDASQMFYGVKHLTLGNKNIDDTNEDSLSARYGADEKFLPYTIINENIKHDNIDDIESITSIYRDMNYDTVSSYYVSSSQTSSYIGIDSRLSVGNANFEIYLVKPEDQSQIPTLTTVSIPFDSYAYYQSLNVYNHDLYGKYATNTQSDTKKNLISIATDNSGYIQGDDAIVYSLSANYTSDGTTVKWEIKDAKTNLPLFTIQCGEGEKIGNETVSYAVKIIYGTDSHTIYSTNTDFVNDCYLTINYVIRNINGIYRICPMFIINIGNGSITGVVYDKGDRDDTDKLFVYETQDIETVYTTIISDRTVPCNFIRLLDSYGTNIDAYIYNIALPGSNKYHLIYTKDNTNLTTSFLYSIYEEGKDNSYAEIQDQYGNLFSFSVVTYNTDLINNNRKHNILTIEESELPNNNFQLVNANRMFYNVKSPNLFNGYDKLITKFTTNTDQMFKINCEGDTEHNLYDEYDFTTVDVVDENNTFYKCGRIFKEMKEAPITSAYEMFKNRYFANEFPFYSEGSTNKDRKASLSIPNTLINGTGMFENCRIYHSNKFNTNGTVLQLYIPASLQYGDRMFKNFNRISDKEVVPNVELRLGDSENPNIYISDNLSCDEMFAGCQFNNNDISIPLSMSFPNVNTYLFEGSNFNFNNVANLEFRKNNFGSYHDNDRKFFTPTTTFGLLKSDISKWFNEGVQLLSVLNSNTGNQFNLEIGYDEASDFKNAIMNISNKGRYDKYYSKLIDSTTASSEPYNLKSFKLNNIVEIAGDRISCMFNPSMLFKYSSELTTPIRFKVLNSDMTSEFKEIYDFDGINSVTLFVKDDNGNSSWRTINSSFIGHVNALALSGESSEECYLPFPRDEHYLGDMLHIPMKYNDDTLQDGFYQDTIGVTYGNIEFNRLEKISAVEMPYAFSGLPNVKFSNLKTIDGGLINGYGAFEYCPSATFEKLEKITINHTINDDAYSNAYLKNNVENTNWVGNFSNMFAGCSSATFDNLNTLSIYSNSKELPNGDVFNYYYDANGDLVVNAVIIQEPEMKISHVSYEENGEYVLNFNTLDTESMRLSNDLLSIHTGIASGSVVLSAYGAELIANSAYVGDDKNILVPSKELLTVFAHVSGYSIKDNTKKIERYFVVTNNDQVYKYDGSLNIENEFKNPEDETSLKSLRYIFKEVGVTAKNYYPICTLSTSETTDTTDANGKPLYCLTGSTANRRSIMLYKQAYNEFASSIIEDEKNTTSSFYKIRVEESDDKYVTITFNDYEGNSIASIHTLLSDERYESKVEFDFYMNEKSGNVCIMTCVRESYNKSKYYFLTENGFLQEFTEKPDAGDYFYIGSLQYDTRLATIHNYCDSLFSGCSSATFKNLQKVMICGKGSCRNLFNGCISQKIEDPKNNELSIIRLKYFLLPTNRDTSINGNSYNGVFRGCVMNRFDFSALNKISTNIHILGENSTPTLAKSLFEGILDGGGNTIDSKNITPELINSLTGLSFSVLNEMDFSDLKENESSDVTDTDSSDTVER